MAIAEALNRDAVDLSGTAPGHIGTRVWPGDDCQTCLCCAFKPPIGNTTQRAKIKGFIIIAAAYTSTTSDYKLGRVYGLSKRDFSL